MVLRERGEHRIIDSADGITGRLSWKIGPSENQLAQRVLWRMQFGLSVTVLLRELRLLVAQVYSSVEAVRRMTVAEGFDVSLVASEPLVR